jgi:hypothetical protein
MKRNTLTLGLLVALMGCVQSCNKEQVQVATPASLTPQVTNRLQAVFAKTLSKAIQSDPALRSFLQSESLKQFDMDYDVLYQMVKDAPIANGETFRERLTHYMPAQELAALEQQLPLLTIFIPTLPSGFSPKTWQPDQEIPQIAVRQLNDAKTPLFNGASGEETVIEPDLIPGFPVIVVKQNERVVVNGGTAVLGQSTRSFYQNAQFSFSFSSPAYDGEAPRSAKAPASGSTNRVAYDSYATGTLKMSYPNVLAYNIDIANPNYQWQRDYVYYGLTPTTSRGRLKDNFRETIRAFRLTEAGITKISGSSGNPTTPTVGSSNFINTNIWTDGKYEFLITVLFNPKDGSAPQTNIRFGATPSDVYDISYNKSRVWNSFDYYTITGVTPKEFHPEIPIATWDLSNFGTAWTYHVFEENQTVIHTEQQKVTTSYAANFGYDVSAGTDVKIGVKFGANTATTSERTVTLQYTEGSTDLGEKISYFYDPIITSTTSRSPFTPAYNTYDLALAGAASNVFLSVEPYSLIESQNNP